MTVKDQTRFKICETMRAKGSFQVITWLESEDDMLSCQMPVGHSTRHCVEITNLRTYKRNFKVMARLPDPPGFLEFVPLATMVASNRREWAWATEVSGGRGRNQTTIEGPELLRLSPGKNQVYISVSLEKVWPDSDQSEGNYQKRLDDLAFTVGS